MQIPPRATQSGWSMSELAGQAEPLTGLFKCNHMGNPIWRSVWEG